MLMYAWKIACRAIADEELSAGYLCGTLSDIAIEAEPLLEPKHEQMKTQLMWYTPEFLFNHRQELSAASMADGNPDRVSAIMTQLFKR